MKSLPSGDVIDLSIHQEKRPVAVEKQTHPVWCDGDGKPSKRPIECHLRPIPLPMRRGRSRAWGGVFFGWFFGPPNATIT